jgi:6,7-dimethyl-8-ribityllumazine synthase
MVSSKSKSSLPKNAAEGKRFAIVVSRYHEELSQLLHAGALEALKALGAKEDDISTFWVPGSFEIPAAARAISQHRDVDAIVCLGVILKGETPHNEYIAREVARGIAQIHAATGIPVTFGVLTPDTLDQAKARSGGIKGNKGAESAEAAVAMIHLLNEIKQGAKKQSKSVGF